MARSLSLAHEEEDARPAGSTKPARPTPHVLQAPLAGLETFVCKALTRREGARLAHACSGACGITGLFMPHAAQIPSQKCLIVEASHHPLTHSPAHLLFELCPPATLRVT